MKDEFTFEVIEPLDHEKGALGRGKYKAKLGSIGSYGKSEAVLYKIYDGDDIVARVTKEFLVAKQEKGLIRVIE